MSQELLDLGFPLVILAVLGVAIPVGMVALNRLLAGPGRSGPASKFEPYECGLDRVVGSAQERFSVKFFLVAMAFLVFSVEVAFLYPWAVHFMRGGSGMLAMLFAFLVVIEAAYLYLWRKGALDWDR